MIKKIIDIPRLEPHLYTEEDYHALKRTIDRMIQDGAVLFSRLD
ncbi:MAG: hypothetical protein ACUVRM_09475 [Bacillota bacterium]